MKTYPDFIQFDNGFGLIRKLKLYNTDNNIGIYYSLITNFYIGVGWSMIGLMTISDDPDLDNLQCFEITKQEFYK